jgi:hypothetical protein
MDRQGIHVGAQADRAIAASGADHTDHAGFGDPGMNLVDAELAQLLRHEGSRGMLLKAELGMGVKMPPPSGEVVVEAGDAVDHGHGMRSSFTRPPSRPWSSAPS